MLAKHLDHNQIISTINLLGSMDKNSAIAVSALIAFLGFLPSAALSHSGGTNFKGCHTESKTGKSHCHTPKNDPPPDSSRSSGSRGRSSGLSGSSRSTPPSSGFSGSGSRAVPTYSRKSASGLSREDYELNEDCQKFAFSEILGQADRGYVRLRCGQLIMSIIAH